MGLIERYANIMRLADEARRREEMVFSTIEDTLMYRLQKIEDEISEKCARGENIDSQTYFQRAIGILMSHWRMIGHDFAPLMGMLNRLPNRSIETWFSIMGDPWELHSFFKAVHRYKTALRAANNYEEECTDPEVKHHSGPLQPGKLREDCRHIAEKAITLLEEICKVLSRLPYRFKETTLLDVFNKEFPNTFQEMSEVGIYCSSELYAITNVFRALGYDGDEEKIKGNPHSVPMFLVFGHDGNKKQIQFTAEMAGMIDGSYKEFSDLLYRLRYNKLFSREEIVNLFNRRECAVFFNREKFTDSLNRGKTSDSFSREEIYEFLDMEAIADHFDNFTNTKAIAEFSDNLNKNDIDRLKKNGVIQEDSTLIDSPRYDLAKELLDMIEGVKRHVMDIWAMIVLHIEDGRTVNDLKNRDENSIALWLEQKSDRAYRALSKLRR